MQYVTFWKKSNTSKDKENSMLCGCLKSFDGFYNLFPYFVAVRCLPNAHLDRCASVSPAWLPESASIRMLRPHVLRQRPAWPPPPWVIAQPLQALLHKTLYPFVDMATAHTHSGGNGGDRHPVSHEDNNPRTAGQTGRDVGCPLPRHEELAFRRGEADREGRSASTRHRETFQSRVLLWCVSAAWPCNVSVSAAVRKAPRVETAARRRIGLLDRTIYNISIAVSHPRRPVSATGHGIGHNARPVAWPESGTRRIDTGRDKWRRDWVGVPRAVYGYALSMHCHSADMEALPYVCFWQTIGGRGTEKQVNIYIIYSNRIYCTIRGLANTFRAVLAHGAVVSRAETVVFWPSDVYSKIYAVITATIMTMAPTTNQFLPIFPARSARYSCCCWSWAARWAVHRVSFSWRVSSCSAMVVSCALRVVVICGRVPETFLPLLWAATLWSLTKESYHPMTGKHLPCRAVQRCRGEPCIDRGVLDIGVSQPILHKC